MERRFSNSDFERYVQDNADQYRMFPSEKVWNRVHNAMHKRRRWYGLGLAFLLLLTGTAVTFVMRSYPVARNLSNSNTPTSVDLQAFNDQPVALEPADIRDITPFEASSRQMENAIREQLQPVPNGIIDEEDLNFADDEFLASFREKIATMAEQQEQEKVAAEIQQPATAPSIRPALIVDMASYPRRQDQVMVMSHPEPVAADEKPLPESRIQNPSPISIESITNSYKPGPKKVSWQLFFTPTVSYRALSVNKGFTGSAGGALPYPFEKLEDVNNAVTHKPDLGFQVGLMARYPVSKRINFRAGLQLNVNKYDIKAFAYPGEVAVINLDDSYSTTVATWTRYRSQSGYKSDWLKNYYLSVSIPVGAEVMLFGNKHTQVGGQLQIAF